MDERDILNLLSVLACESRVFTNRLREALVVIECLSADVDEAGVAVLIVSVTVGVSDPARYGTAADIGARAAAVVRELQAMTWL